MTHAASFLFLWHWTAPTRQVIRIYAFCQLKGFIHRFIEIAFNGLALHAPPQKVGPKEFAKWRGILGKTTRPSQFTCERAEWIVHELVYGFRQVLVSAPTAIRI